MLYVDIKKKLKNFNLDVSFSTDSGIMGLLGASGSGKSYTLKCIAGIEKPDSGKIILNDRVLFDSEKKINLSPQQRKIGYLFQDYALFPNMTVKDNILTGIRKKEGINPQEIALEKIKEMSLQGVENKRPREISGGQKQRTALARLLVNEPEILLLDEPFSALDEYLKWKIEIEIKEIINHYNIPSLFVSHNRDEIYRMCDSVCFLKDGKSEEKVEKNELFKHPRTYASALLSGCKNFSKIEKIGENKIRAIDWDLEFTVEDIKDEDMIGIRANNIKLTNNKDEINSIPLEIEKEIDELFFMALMAKTNNPKENIRIEINKDKWDEVKDIEDLYLKIHPEDIMLLHSKE